MAEPNVDIVIDCADPDSLADFWAAALGYTKAFAYEQYWILLPPVPGIPLPDAPG